MLNIKLLDNLSVYEAFVDAILWCCRPQSLTLISDFSAINFEERIRVVEVIKVACTHFLYVTIK